MTDLGLCEGGGSRGGEVFVTRELCLLLAADMARSVAKIFPSGIISPCTRIARGGIEHL
jgi:hypothetical protein